MPSMPASYMSEYRRRKRALGECLDCKAPARAGATRCERHAQMATLATQRWQAKRAGVSA